MRQFIQHGLSVINCPLFLRKITVPTSISTLMTKIAIRGRLGCVDGVDGFTTLTNEKVSTHFITYRTCIRDTRSDLGWSAE